MSPAANAASAMLMYRSPDLSLMYANAPATQTNTTTSAADRITTNLVLTFDAICLNPFPHPESGGAVTRGESPWFGPFWGYPGAIHPAGLSASPARTSSVPLTGHPVGSPQAAPVLRHLKRRCCR